MKTHLYKNDLPEDVKFSGTIAVDTEAMGLDPARDRLCLIQIYSGTGDCHMVQFDNIKNSSPNLIKLLGFTNELVKLKISYYFFIKAFFGI